MSIRNIGTSEGKHIIHVSTWTGSPPAQPIGEQGARLLERASRQGVRETKSGAALLDAPLQRTPPRGRLPRPFRQVHGPSGSGRRA